MTEVSMSPPKIFHTHICDGSWESEDIHELIVAKPNYFWFECCHKSSAFNGFNRKTPSQHRNKPSSMLFGNSE